MRIRNVATSVAHIRWEFIKRILEGCPLLTIIAARTGALPGNARGGGTVIWLVTV